MKKALPNIKTSFSNSFLLIYDSCYSLNLYYFENKFSLYSISFIFIKITGKRNLILSTFILIIKQLL